MTTCQHCHEEIRRLGSAGPWIHKELGFTYCRITVAEPIEDRIVLFVGNRAQMEHWRREQMLTPSQVYLAYHAEKQLRRLRRPVEIVFQDDYVTDAVEDEAVTYAKYLNSINR